MPYETPMVDHLPAPDSVHTMIVALQHASRHAKIDRTTAHVVGQAAHMLAAFDRHRSMYEKRRHTLHRVLGRVLREYQRAPEKRESEYEVMISVALTMNAIERDEPIAWIPGQLVGPLFLRRE